jgi:hypothetical protein
VAKVRERLAANKRKPHSIHMQRFNPKKLNRAEGEEKYRVDFSNWFEALEDLDAEVEVTIDGERIRENVKISATESLGI